MLDITQVRVERAATSNRSLLAYASLVFDESLVVCNMRLVQGRSRIFVAMPDELVKHRCGQCPTRNVVGARFCNGCGRELIAADPIVKNGRTSSSH